MKKQLLFLLFILSCSLAFAIHYSEKDVLNESINKDNTHISPQVEFIKWYKQAEEKLGVTDARAMTLSTVTKDGHPNARIMNAMVSPDGEIVFYGHRDSLKFKEIESNPNVSITFYWSQLQKQVIIAGAAEKILRELAVKRFKERKRELQIASHVSDQGKELLSQDQLEQKYKDIEKQYKDKDIPCPDTWVGYKVKPTIYKFWHAGHNGMHSTVEYYKMHGSWKKKLLQP